MKTLLGILLLAFFAPTLSRANNTNIFCEGEGIYLQIKSLSSSLEASVYTQDSTGQWFNIYQSQVKRSTTRGTNLLFLGQDFGVGILSNINSFGNHTGTLRMQAHQQMILETLQCRF